MQQVIVELDDQLVERLEQVAPASKRKRSDFIREAIRRALIAHAEAQLEEGYRRIPPDDVEIDIDTEAWAPDPVRNVRKRKRR